MAFMISAPFLAICQTDSRDKCDFGSIAHAHLQFATAKNHFQRTPDASASCVKGFYVGKRMRVSVPEPFQLIDSCGARVQFNMVRLISARRRETDLLQQLLTS